jgi:peptidoglycan/LPS O-acetylase OafA/YrhL
MSNIKYRADIDGLRAIAVFAVVLHHVWPSTISGGFVGVDIFFVISGFLISRIVVGDMQRGTFSFAGFYQRRARRILPALTMVLLGVLAAGWLLLLPTDYLATLRASLGTVLFSSNFVFWRDLSLGYFAHDAKLNPLLHTWSLGVEEQFYLLYPLFLYLCYRFAPGRLQQLVAIGLIASFSIAVALIESRSVAVFFLAPFRAWELLVGCALAIGMVPTIQAKG